jgi:uncharacterized metal-binding protein YceD (DUF177 family)
VLQFEADAHARARLASLAGVTSVERLSAQGLVTLAGEVIEVRLHMSAAATQQCVVTLAPVPALIDEEILRRFVPEDAQSGQPPGTVEIGPTDEDPAEPLTGEAIDLGPVLSEHFILSLDPYPRAPGAELEAEEIGDRLEGSPFAVLRGLKDRN